MKALTTLLLKITCDPFYISKFSVWRSYCFVLRPPRPPGYEYRLLTHSMTQQTSHLQSIPPTLFSFCFNCLIMSNVNRWSNSLWIFLQFYTDSQFAAPHVLQLALLSRSPNQLFVYKFEQSGGPDLYTNTLNITGIPSWILLCLHVYIYIYTGRFIMHSGITKIYIRKPAGHVFTKPVQIEGTTQNFFSQ